jgi:L-alanine-DL-glutamate epimerase-like enolase superfamily enzyme
MKVSKVECLPVHSGWRKNFVFVRVETDSGIVGWGEAYSQYDRDRAVTAQVEELGRYLIGRDPFQIRHFLQIAFDDYAQRRGSLEFYCATSGIEQALWDIAGKATDQPVYNLLGGPCRRRRRQTGLHGDEVRSGSRPLANLRAKGAYPPGCESAACDARCGRSECRSAPGHSSPPRADACH